VCQECTPWSGLGAVDILADVIDVPFQARDELRGWYERHAAFYRILSVSNETIEALNIINGRPYRIRVSISPNPFVPGQFLYGSLVPWQGEWYWSGEQKVWDDASAVDVGDLTQTMKRQSSRIVCRYCPEYEAQVWQRASALHHAALDYYGTDLMIYRDGMSMAADLQKELRGQWDSRSPDEVRDVIQRHGLTKGRPDMKIPPELLEHNDGIGIFLNPDEGKEIMTHFTPLIAGLKRRGENLTEDEKHAIRAFFQADGVSPRFVRRVLAEYGDESVRAVFLLKGELPGHWLDYLLRSHKGQFYRKRYPHLAVV
jgi:hypothetical protein